MKKRLMRHLAAFVLAFTVMAIFPTIIAHATGDPTGASLGSAADIPAATAGKPTLDEIALVVGHNKISINFVWTLITGFIVMFMQAGFAMVESGFTRAKNVAHTM